MFVCFAYMIKTHEPLGQFDPNFLENSVGPWVRWVGPLLYRKKAQIVCYDQARVNGGSNYE